MRGLVDQASEIGFNRYTRYAIVEQAFDKRQAAVKIAYFAETDIPETHRAHFIETVETELISLHEGNIARFQLRRSSFQKWHPSWR